MHCVLETAPVLIRQGTQKNLNVNQKCVTTETTFFYIENFFADALSDNPASSFHSKRPKRGYVFCPDCGRPKQLFKSQNEADRFILYNKDSILDEIGFCPVRTYYCEACGGWHITSQPLDLNCDRSRSKEKCALILQHKKSISRRNNVCKKLDMAEQYINIALANFKKDNKRKAHKHLRRAFQVFQQTLTSECYKARKLAIFSRLSLCYEMWPV